LICHPDRSGRHFLAHRSLVRRPRSGGTVAIFKPTPKLVQPTPLLCVSAISALILSLPSSIFQPHAGTASSPSSAS
jgi:hypothetical protein